MGNDGGRYYSSNRMGTRISTVGQNEGRTKSGFPKKLGCRHCIGCSTGSPVVYGRVGLFLVAAFFILWSAFIQLRVVRLLIAELALYKILSVDTESIGHARYNYFFCFSLYMRYIHW